MKDNGALKLSLLSDSIKHKFRQKRFHADDVLLKIKIGKESFNILNWSRTGIAFLNKTSLEFKLEDRLNSCVVFFDDEEVQKLDIEVVNVSTHKDFSRIGVKFLNKTLLVEKIEALKEVNRFKAHSSNIKQGEIDPEIYSLAFNVVLLLDNFSDNCSDFEKQISFLPLEERKRSEESYIEAITPVITEKLRTFNSEIGSRIDVDSIPEGSMYHKLFDKLLYPYFKNSSLAKRAKEKPLGYAGDFEMMNQIYRNGYEGDDLAGKILHNYIANERSSQSVTFRKPYFISKYEKHLARELNTVNVLSLASGPCVEFQQMVKDFDQDVLNRIDLTLFDLDRTSLEFAQTQIYNAASDHKKDVKVDFINASVKILLEESAKHLQNSFDFIYSGGLFDYFDNRTSAALITNLFSLLKPGGEMIIGNFTHENPTKVFCHFVTDWHLIHKSEEEIRKWCKYLNKDLYDSKIEYDDNGINAFLCITKKE